MRFSFARAGALAVLGVFAAERPAHADASAWVFAGAGTLGWKQGDASLDLAPALSFDAGVGTSPDKMFVLGGLFRVAPILGAGTDLALLARGATRGFQAGDFGLAIDAGGYERFWGEGSEGFAGGISLGAPLGLELSLRTMVGTDDALAFGGVLGFDFARLTVYRQTLLDWWPNPLPAQKRRRDSAKAPSPPAGR